MKMFVTVIAVALLISGAAFAQATSPDQSQASPSSQSQASQSQSQSNSTDQTITGCLVRHEEAVFLHPAGGGAPIKVSGSQDLGSDMSHQARLTGHYDTSQSASSANSQSSQSSVAGSQSSQSQSAPNFIVTKVESTTTSCPAKASPDTSSPSTTPPPQY